MTRSDDIYALPANLPAPADDGGARHLPGLRLPSLALPATDGSVVDLATLRGRTVVYCYPRTGRPDREPPLGWDDIPGARGCTPQSCAFRDHYSEVTALGAGLFGMSTQPSQEQREAAARLHLPFLLLSDQELHFARAVGLPTFDVASMTLLKRLTLIVYDGSIEHVMYPVFPPDRNADDVVEWLRGVDVSHT